MINSGNSQISVHQQHCIQNFFFIFQNFRKNKGIVELDENSESSKNKVTFSLNNIFFQFSETHNPYQKPKKTKKFLKIFFFSSKIFLGSYFFQIFLIVAPTFIPEKNSYLEKEACHTGIIKLI